MPTSWPTWLWPSPKDGKPITLAKSLRAKANALYALDQHAAAIDLHRRAAAIFEQEGDEEELARTLSGSIQPLLLLGHYALALAAADRARELFAKQGNTFRLARLDINIGNIYHRQDRFADALACYERAYPDVAANDDAEGMAAVMSDLPLCYMHLNEFSRALEMYQKAREHCQKRDMPILVAYADYNIAYLYFLRGEYGARSRCCAKPPRAARRPTTLIRSRCAAWTCLKSTLMRIYS